MLSKSSMNNNITHQQQDTLEVTAEIKPTRKRGRPLGSTGSYKKRVESASKPRTRLSQRLIENVSKVDVTTGLIDDSMADKTMASYSEGRKMMPVPMGIRYDEVLYDILDMQIDFGYISGQLDLKVKNDEYVTCTC
jgi:hypothetical protein